MEIIKVKKIISGDTFVGENDEHYRLSGVYAPEVNRDGDQEATEALKKLILNKELEILKEQDNLSHGRSVVGVRVVGEEESVNKKINIFISKL